MVHGFYVDIIKEIKKQVLTARQLNKIKIGLVKKYKLEKIPTTIDILLHASKKDIEILKHRLQTKPVRTISGVAIVAIMGKPINCKHGSCIYCPGGEDSAFGNVPKSYTGKEPATRRAIRNAFDPYLQVFNRLEQYVVLGHMPSKVEMIIMGGTFPSFTKTYRDYFIKNALKAMNDFSDKFFSKGEFDFETALIYLIPSLIGLILGLVLWFTRPR